MSEDRKEKSIPHLFRPGSRLGLELIKLLNHKTDTLFSDKELDQKSVEERFLRILREQSQK